MCGKCENAHAERIFFLWPVGTLATVCFDFLRGSQLLKVEGFYWIYFLIFFLHSICYFSLCLYFHSKQPSIRPLLLSFSLFPSLHHFPSLSSVLFLLVSHFHSVPVFPFTIFCFSLPCISCFHPLQLTPLDKQDSKFALQHCVHHHILHCNRYQWNRRHLHNYSPSYWCFLCRLFLPSSPPSSSPQELPLTGCSRIIESSIDRMGYIDSLHCSILFLLSTAPPPPHPPPTHLFWLFFLLSLSLATPVTLFLPPCLLFLLWSLVVTVVIHRIDNSTTSWSICLITCLRISLFVCLPACCMAHHSLLWPKQGDG